jgi:hypothetical protein
MAPRFLQHECVDALAHARARADKKIRHTEGRDKNYRDVRVAAPEA